MNAASPQSYGTQYEMGRRVAVAHLACAWVDLESYRLSAGWEELGKAGLALAESPDPLMSILHRLISARTEVALGRPELALRTLGEVGDAAQRLPWLERRQRLVISEAHAVRGSADAARVAAEHAGGAGTPGSGVALARGEMCRGEPVAAADMVRRALVESAAVPTDVRVDAWLFDAFLRTAEGTSPGGVALLTERSGLPTVNRSCFRSRCPGTGCIRSYDAIPSCCGPATGSSTR